MRRAATTGPNEALGWLSYGMGTLAPEGVVQYSAGVGNPVHNGHRMVIDDKERKANGRQSLSPITERWLSGR